LARSSEFLRTGEVETEAASYDTAMASVSNETDRFYSQLLKTVQDNSQAKATPEQWLATMRKSGVKQEEMDWMGIEEFMSGKKTVTKDELAEFVASNQVEIQEVTKGGGQAPTEAMYDSAIEALMRQDNLGYDYAEQALSDATNEDNWRDVWEVTDEQDAEIIQAYIDAQKSVTGNSTKFGQWQLPGGENYKELLLTLPESQSMKPTEHPSGTGWALQLPDGSLLKNGPGTASPDSVRQWDNLRDAVKYGVPAHDKTNYRSNHYDEPNILAHIRFNERTDADGRKILFLEELQSDFGQQTRKQRQAIKDSVENNFQDIIDRMEKEGAIEVNCD
ncbi:MAG: hypothetical protein WD572_11630, partial [Gammaproteobacteria bacterium]